MRLKPKITIEDHFSDMEDPRVEWSIQHKLIDIITIAICAVICGADTQRRYRNLWTSQRRVVQAIFRIS